MFFIGICSIVQMLFIPGLLLRKYFKYPDNFFLSLSTIIGVSLTANYLVVFLLTALQLFIRPLVLALFLIELGLLFYLYRKTLSSQNIETSLGSIWQRSANSIRNLFSDDDGNQSRFAQIIRYLIILLLLIAALTSIEWISRYFRSNIGTVFNSWDAVFSWNKWAVDWAHNTIPLSTDDYPQLIPTNWAITYVFMGTHSVQLFAKGVMPLFSLLMLLSLFGAAVKTKNPGYFLSVTILYFVVKKFSADYIAEGYVDLPLAFMTLMAFWLLYEVHVASNIPQKRQYFLTAVVLASGAAVTKQSGLYTLIGVLVIGYIELYRKVPLKTQLQNWKEILPILIVPLIVALPWYAFKYFHILTGIASDSHLFLPAQQSASAHQTAGMLATIIPGLLSLEKYLVLVALLLPSILIISRYWKIIGGLIVIPYVLLWAAYASYDVRNLTPMFPLIAVVTGTGIYAGIDYSIRKLDKLKAGQIKSSWLLILLVVCTALAGLLITSEKIIEKQAAGQREIFSPELNNAIYEYFENTPKGKILTNYPIDYMPGLDGLQVNHWYQSADEFFALLSSENISYLLVPQNGNPEIFDYIDGQIQSGNYSVLFENSDFLQYRFIKVKSK